MQQDEFEQFCLSTGMINDGFAAREIPLVFNLSMFTQVDEIDKQRHIDATLLEFMEMICRACAQASFGPPPVENEDGTVTESNMPYS